MRKLNRDYRGMTLVEVIMIIVILGILAGIAVPQYQDIQLEAKKNTLRSSLYTVRRSIETWQVAQAAAGTPGLWPGLDSLSIAGYVLEHDFPGNPFQGSDRAPDSIVLGVVKGQIVGDRGGWAYKPSTGEIWPNTSSTESGSGCSGSTPINENLW